MSLLWNCLPLWFSHTLPLSNSWSFQRILCFEHSEELSCWINKHNHCTEMSNWFSNIQAEWWGTYSTHVSIAAIGKLCKVKCLCIKYYWYTNRFNITSNLTRESFHVKRANLVEIRARTDPGLPSLVIFIDREAREIMYLVASVRLSVRLSVCISIGIVRI